MIAFLQYWYPTILLFFQCAALGYAFRCAQIGRRRRDEGDRYCDLAKAHLDAVGDLLAHMIADHDHLHKPHSHEDTNFAPSVH